LLPITSNTHTHSHTLYCYNEKIKRFGAVRPTALSAEDKWTEKDYTAELKTLEKDAETRLDEKISELMGKIETTGATK
jgi:hypothetical protein